MLARSVDARERLLVQQELEAVAVAHAFIDSMTSMLWSVATLAYSKVDGRSRTAGETSLCRVLTGTPSLYGSVSVSSMDARTRSGMAPK